MSGNDLTFIHLTDIHILAKGAEPFMGINTGAKLQTAIDHIKKSGVKPAFFAISGDIIQDAEDSAYEHVKELLTGLDEFNVPVLMAMGNHDNRVAFQRVFLNDENPDEQRRHYESHVFNGFKVIILDSRESGQVYGTFDDAQMAWLKEELAEGLPSILIFHHPPVITPYAMLDNHLLLPDSIEKLADAIAGHNVFGILNGHIHFNNLGSFNGVPAFAGGHVAFMLDPYETDGMTFNDGGGYNVVTIKNGTYTLNPIILPGERQIIRHISGDQLAHLMADHSE